MGRLVELEVENFKSYRGRQTIGPFYNFTSVIGPNGSGKSNLMDAISFVLGVKSSQLRSSQLKELIYRGGRAASEGSESDDDTNMPKRAYVCAIYEKSDETILRFMRTVTASGTSEYRINDKTVPFSRYSAALEEENILIKAKNFLVFQGDVEAVAAQSPKDLTRLIEQISGSLELKAEYERLKGLQEMATENSAHTFNKKRGINAEMKQFKEQKEEAERFAKFQKQREKQITTHLTWRLFHLNQKIEELEAEIEQEKGNSEKYEQQMSELESQLKDAKRQHARTNKELMRLEKKLNEKNKELDDRKPELVQVEEKIRHASKKLKTAQENVAKARKEHEKEVSLIKDLQKDHSDLIKALTKYEETIRKKNADKGLQLDEAQLAEYNEKKDEIRRRTFAEKQELVNLQRQKKTDEENKLRLEENVQALRNRKAQLEDEEGMLAEREDKLEDQVEQLVKDVEKARRELEAAEAEKQRLFQSETELNEKLVETQQKLQQARVDRQESEREARQKEMLEELKRVFSGVYGRVLDLCKPTQRKYQLAVSIILGRNMDAIVVDTEKTAIECIQYLREQRTGMATFLPLDTIKTKGVNERLRHLKGAHLALDVIQFDDIHARALNYACGNALVCDSLDIARDICYNQGIEVKAVTLDGTVIHKAGMITGGTSGADHRNARRWDEKEVEGLKKVHTSLMTQMQELSRSQRRVNKDDNLRSALTDLEAKLRTAKDDLKTTSRKLEGLRSDLRHTNEQINANMPPLQEVERTLESLDERIEEADSKIRDAEKQVFATFCKKIGVKDVREYEERQLKMTQEVTEKKMQFETQKAKLENQLEFEKSKVKGTEERIRKLEAAITADRQSIEEFETEKERVETENAKLAEEIEQATAQLNVLKEELERKQAAVSRAKKEIQKLNKEVEGRNKNVAAKESEIEKLCTDKFSIFRRCKLEEIDLPLLEGSLEDLSLDQLEAAQRTDPDSMDIDQDTQTQTQSSRARVQAIEVDFSHLKAAHKQDGSDEMELEFQETIKNLSAEIERIAPNMRAVDRLDEVENKLKETAKEFDNARKEAKSAKDAFTKIKQERYERFHAAFSHIAEKIDPIYKELTKSKTFPLGGTAYLSLEDSEEPYNDGVKYHAMPPMKRFRDMELLSGGEKTVAALALLFAIHSYQPAPFFVLDEVDAALDNANVAKVANYIRKHSSDTFQFIVISLKHTFYEKAEALVGIYRDQSVESSKVLTLGLERFLE